MTDRPRRPARATLLAVLLLLGVFIAGALSGAAADRVLDAREVAPLQVTPPGSPARSAGDGTVGRRQARGSPPAMLQRRLELTSEQREQVEAIFERRRARTAAILREFEPQMQAQRDSTDIEIRAILTPEQQERFDLIVRQRRSGPRDFRGSPGRPDGR